MASFFRRIFNLWRGSRTRSYAPTIDTNFSIFQEGDRAVINTTKAPILSKPLKRGQKVPTPRGNIEHKDIIGKGTRDAVRTAKGIEYRITYPTLSEYVTWSPRLVTPVYPADANLIVSLLDIHTPGASSQRGEHGPLEILEAGTGHGSLTLHLARAINAANTCPPPIPKTSQCQILSGQPTRNSPPNPQGGSVIEDDARQRDWDEWREQRGAVLHTVDVKPSYSAHAENIVRGFRRGMYAGNVDFYVSSVEDWIQEQSRRRRTKSLLSKQLEPFLSYAILDMPSAHVRIPNVAPILKPDGILAVFMPNITQIGDCVDIIRQQKLPLVLDRTVELGTGISSGRLWDVRTVTKRAKLNAVTEAKGDTPEKVMEESSEGSPNNESDEEASATGGVGDKGETVLVCRPKVGERIVGGGFVGIWRRMKH